MNWESLFGNLWRAQWGGIKLKGTVLRQAAEVTAGTVELQETDLEHFGNFFFFIFLLFLNTY